MKSENSRNIPHSVNSSPLFCFWYQTTKMDLLHWDTSITEQGWRIKLCIMTEIFVLSLTFLWIKMKSRYFHTQVSSQTRRNQEYHILLLHLFYFPFFYQTKNANRLSISPMQMKKQGWCARSPWVIGGSGSGEGIFWDSFHSPAEWTPHPLSFSQQYDCCSFKQLYCELQSH